MKSAAGAVLLFVVSSAFGSGVLFPTPLHLVRQVDDPIAHSATLLDEYCYGNRIVTVNGPRVAIVDYAEQRLTEIDHALVTYSVTRFDDIAKARPPLPESKAKSEWAMNVLGANAYQFAGAGRKVDVSVDRTIVLSRDAVEALVGAAYPNRRSEEHDQILRAAAPATGGGRVVAQSAEPLYGLPSDTTVTYENGLTLRNVISRIDHALPPPQVMLIDPGAALVESKLTRLTREMQQLDALPSRH